MKSKVGWIKTGLVAAFVLAAFWIVWSGPAANAEVKIKEGALETEEHLYPTNEYGWLTYYMHEVFERYQHAKTAFDKQDYDLARTNLKVMEYYLELSKEHLPDTLQDGAPFDKEDYKKKMDKLAEFSKDIRENIKENKKWAETSEGELDPMLKTCVGCHDAYNIPTDFRIDTKFKVLTHVMHEIYELYRQAGPMLQEEKWDKAKLFFVVLEPYIESIPENIPETNQDGEKIDMELFKKTYKELDQFTDDMIKRLETKSWMGGKPLPPPRIVVDNCYACHAEAAKIPPPW